MDLQAAVSTCNKLGGYGMFLVFIFLILFCYHQLSNSTRFAKLGNAIPGPPLLPIIGYLPRQMLKSPPELMQFVLKVVRDNMVDNKVLKIWVGNRLFVGIVDSKDVEVILGSHTHLEKSKEYALFEPWLGEGLLISKGDKWREHRKMIVPTFHQAILKTFVPIFNKKSKSMISSLKKNVGREFDVHDYMSTLTVDILLETVMGLGDSKDNDKGFQYAKAVMDMCNILHQRHYKVWLWSDFIFGLTNFARQQKEYLSIIHSFTKKVLERKKREYVKDSNHTNTYGKLAASAQSNIEKTKSFKTQHKSDATNVIRDDLDFNDVNDIGEKKRTAFLDFMIEASHMPGYHLTDEEIKEEVDTIMFEGHDTTAAAISFCLCVLGIYSDIQNKVVEELKMVLGDTGREVTFEDTTQMKYLERVIMETLRLYPPVPVISRKLNEEVTLPSGYVLPTNATVIVGTYVIHRDPRYYDDPLRFNPDNFLPEKCQDRDYYSYIPFSAGPRSCVGRKYAMLKMKVVLASILSNFKVTSNVQEKDFLLQADIILKRADGFRVVFNERVKC